MSKGCVWLVHEMAKAANLFSDVIREGLDGNFLRQRGRFLVSDDFQHGESSLITLRARKLGYWRDGRSRWCLGDWPMLVTPRSGCVDFSVLVLQNGRLRNTFSKQAGLHSLKMGMSLTGAACTLTAQKRRLFIMSLV